VGESQRHRQAVTVGESGGAAEAGGPARQQFAGCCGGEAIEAGAGELPFVFGSGDRRDVARVNGLAGLGAGAADVVEVLALDPYVAGRAGPRQVPGY
jgi:hypothetical protein